MKISVLQIQNYLESLINSIIIFDKTRPLAEQLDSLHRLYVIEQLEQYLGEELHTTLFEKTPWNTISTLASYVDKKLNKLN